MEGYQCDEVLDKDGVKAKAYTPLPCAPRPTLLGEAAMRRKDQGCRWGEVPNPAQDTHLSYQLILPPLSTGPDQTLTRGVPGILAIHQSCS